MGEPLSHISSPFSHKRTKWDKKRPTKQRLLLKRLECSGVALDLALLSDHSIDSGNRLGVECLKSPPTPSPLLLRSVLLSFTMESCELGWNSFLLKLFSMNSSSLLWNMFSCALSPISELALKLCCLSFVKQLYEILFHATVFNYFRWKFGNRSSLGRSIHAGFLIEVACFA